MESLKLLGLVGVTLMICESGLHVDFMMLKKVGFKASCVAVGGTFLPLGTGLGAMVAFGFPAYPDALACGVSLAPTSVGMAIKMLSEAKAMGLEYGQAIVTAAFVDDILSLVCLTMLMKLADGDASVWGICAPLVWSVLFCGGGALLSRYLWPDVISEFVHWVQPSEVEPEETLSIISPRSERISKRQATKKNAVAADVFAAIDTNNDGVISKEEWEAATQAAATTAPPEEAAATEEGSGVGSGVGRYRCWIWSRIRRGI